MPIGPIIGEGLGIIGGLINANNQREMNDQNWIRQAQMYDTQRKDALADRDFMNAYNSPAEQMKRLKGAGLNPNLVYGQGVQGATGQTSQPRGASPGGPQGIAPRIDLSGIGNAFVQMYQMGLIQAQQKNLTALAALNAQKTNTESYKTRATAAGAVLNEAKIPFAGGMAADAASILSAKAYGEQAKSNLEALHYEIQNKLFSDGVTIQKAVNDLIIQGKIAGKTQADTDLIQQKLKSEQYNTDVMEFKARMARQNINPNDPVWMRALLGLLNKWGLVLPGN